LIDAAPDEGSIGGEAGDTAGREVAPAAEAIRLDGVCKRFGDVLAVDHVTLSVPKGEFLCVIGPSGCGKTTTLRLIAGLEEVSEGHIYLEGRDVTSLPSRERHTPIVWQNFVLFPNLTVRENIEYGLKRAGTPAAARRTVVDELSEMLGLEALLARMPSELSGGQQQRVGLARALAPKRPVLLLDEPLGSLDANMRIAMQAEIKGIQQELGLTFIYVTHNQAEALAMADRIVVMRDGVVEQMGTPAEIAFSPDTRFVAEFVGRNSVVEGRVVEAQGGELRIDGELGESWGRARGGRTFSAGEAVLQVIPSSGVMVRDKRTGAGIEPGKPSDPSEGDQRWNEVTAEVLGAEYQGAHTLILLEAKGTMLRALVPSDRVPPLGEAVLARWKAGDAHVIPAARPREDPANG
jgi:spermidine/putrescine transport system ATP-binding protein